MRLPLAKIWRAFPELDRFDDERCMIYVREAKERRLGAGCVVAVIVAVGGVAYAIGLVMLAGVVEGWVPNQARYDSLLEAISIAMGVVSLIVLTSAILLARDMWLRGAIRARLNTMACPGCGYNLLGLTPLGEAGDQHVICPECGRHVKLTPEMLEQLETLGAGAG